MIEFYLSLSMIFSIINKGLRRKEAPKSMLVNFMNDSVSIAIHCRR